MTHSTDMNRCCEKCIKIEVDGMDSWRSCNNSSCDCHKSPTSNTDGGTTLEQLREKLVKEHRDHFQILGSDREEASTKWLRTALDSIIAATREEDAKVLEARRDDARDKFREFGLRELEGEISALTHAATAIRSKINKKV